MYRDMYTCIYNFFEGGVKKDSIFLVDNIVEYILL